ncbi:MAG: energy-coupling factor transporter transmembrane component T [Clostridia bacterium]|nr:energy-coupling factor transporter transmembrane component T [Clostridia bacterium]
MTAGLKLERLNPSVKAGTVLICVLLLSFQYITLLNTAVLAVCLLLLVFFSDARLKSIAALMAPALVAAFGLFMLGLYYAKDGAVTSDLSSLDSIPFALRAAMSRNLETALQLSTRLMAYAGLGILFALTTRGEDFVISLMHQCRLSPKFAYGILAAFHLMPGMVREYRQVQLAFAARGIKTGPVSVKVIFAMLVNCVRWSESVAMAMESKGFTGTWARTHYTVPRIRWYDWLCAVLAIAGIVLGMIIFR